MIIYPNVSSAYVGLANLLKQGDIQTSRLGDTKEIHPISFAVSDFRNYLIYTSSRVINFPMALAELVWIMNGDNDTWVADYNKQLLEYADEDKKGNKYFNAAYGYRMRKRFLVDQFEDVCETLYKDYNSRQAAIIYRQPYDDKGNAPYKDKACNVSSLFLVRNSKLDITQTVRSQDFIWGLPYNFIQFGYITQAIAERLTIPVGNYFEMVNSLHVYKKHWKDLEDISPELMYHVNMPSIGNVDYNALKRWMLLMQKDMEDENSLDDLYVHNMLHRIDDLDSEFWRDGLRCILAYWFNKNKNYKYAIYILTTCQHSLFQIMMLRYFRKYYKGFDKMYKHDDLDYIKKFRIKFGDDEEEEGEDINV